DRVRHGQYRHADFLRDGLGGELRRRPDFIEIVRKMNPTVGKLRQFPSPIADVVFPGSKVRAVMMVDVARDGSVEVEYIYRMRIFGLQAGGKGVVGLRVFAVKL